MKERLKLTLDRPTAIVSDWVSPSPDKIEVTIEDDYQTYVEKESSKHYKKPSAWDLAVRKKKY